MLRKRWRVVARSNFSQELHTPETIEECYTKIGAWWALRHWRELERRGNYLFTYTYLIVRAK